MAEIKLGKYQHYKGDVYEVIGEAKSSKTKEDMVIYQAMFNDEEHGDEIIWVRSKNNFLANINKEGEEIPRFRFIE